VPPNKFFAAALAQERLLNARIPSLVGDNALLNRAVEILFDLSTCRSSCRGGDHILENLLGRIVNHACGAIMLDAAGFHDEALNLVRSVGEITNLLAYFCLDPSSYRSWVVMSAEERKKKFSPLQVRTAIKKKYEHCSPNG
jgi:hypothetical protein